MTAVWKLARELDINQAAAFAAMIDGFDFARGRPFPINGRIIF
jgi:hypothetical protein